MRGWLDGAVTREEDRELFGLPPRDRNYSVAAIYAAYGLAAQPTAHVNITALRAANE